MLELTPLKDIKALTFAWKTMPRKRPKPKAIRELEKQLEFPLEEYSLDEIEIEWLDPIGGFARDSKNRVVGLSLSGIDQLDPSILYEFEHLQCLIVEDAGLTDISFVAKMNGLIYLNLNRNNIKDCSCLANAWQLTHLSLDENSIKDIEPLYELDLLSVLYLNDNQISNCSGFEVLYFLEELGLACNKIKDCSPLGELSGLTWLNLYHNQIRNCRPLGTLRNLNWLNLGNNKVRSCKALGFLSGLKSLTLETNQIKDCTPLVALENLKELDLRRNLIADLSPLATLAKGTFKFYWDQPIINLDPISLHYRCEIGIHLENNPLQRPPVEIAARGHEAIMAWFSAKAEPQRQLNEAKVLLVGVGGSGKTSLVRALCQQGFDPNQSQTHGIEVARWPYNCNEREVLVHLWDFGGQEIMHATHQFFLSKRSLYLLVLDSRMEDGVEEYWLKLIESFGGESPILVVFSKADANPSYDVDRHRLKRQYPNIIGFQRISNKNGQGLADLQARLRTALSNLDMVASSWPQSWFQVKQTLSALPEDFISYQHYKRICIDKGLVSEDQQRVLLNYLHDLGIALHFPKLEWLDTQVLKPNWITAPIYQLINHPELANSNGELELSKLPILVPNFTKNRIPYLEKLMSLFEICHPIDNNRLLLPDLLSVIEPEHLPFGSGEVLHFSVQYHFLPRSILPRLMVRLYTDIQTEPTGLRYQWRNGVLFQHLQLKSQALVRANYDQRSIDFQLSGPGRQPYLAVLIATLRDIQRNYHKIGAQEQVRCICETCRTGQTRFYFAYEDIHRLEGMGKRTIQCHKSGQGVAIDLLLFTTYGKRMPDRDQCLELLIPLAHGSIDRNAFETLAKRILVMVPPIKGIDPSALLEQAWTKRLSAVKPKRPKSKRAASIKADEPQKLCWVHLSDLHYTNKQAWDSDRILKLLQQDAQKKLEDLGLRPQLLFATGDLGYGEGVTKMPLREQIQATNSYLKNLAQALDIRPESVFVIPGNHDVNRKEVARSERSLLTSLNPISAEELAFVNQMMASQDSENESERDRDWPRLHQRLDDYYAACAVDFPNLYGTNPRQGVYHHMREVNGIQVGIFGMNGAWSCGPDEARGNLWLGSSWQLNQAEKHLSQARLRFGLIHHPPDWYVEVERLALKERLERAFHIMLHGHEHDAWVHSIGQHNGACRHLRVAAGASYAETSAEFGYNLGIIDPTTGKGEIHLRTYNRGGWVLQPIPDRAPNGIWPFHLALNS